MALGYGHEVRVDAVHPGTTLSSAFIRDALTEGSSLRVRFDDRVPRARPGDPAEVAAVVAVLAGPEASYVNGAQIPVDGGLTASTGQADPNRPSGGPLKEEDMAWSTRELAELADTTVNTIRHYHRIGLLEEPQRRSNGYKQYGVEHLVRLVRIRRLAQLGMPLAQVGELGSDGEVAPELLRQLDAGFAEEIKRLQQARCTITTILRDKPGDRTGQPDSTGAGRGRRSSNDHAA